MISVVVCTVEEARLSRLKATLAVAMQGAAWELVAVSGARSMAEGYARGIAQSKGDLLVLCHDDIEVLSPALGSSLESHLANCDVLGVAGTRKLIGPLWGLAGPPHVVGQVAYPQADGTIAVQVFGTPRRLVGKIQAVDGVFMAARREVLSRVPFDPRFDGFHGYDVDFSYGAHKSGLRVGVASDIALLHQSQGKYDDAWKRAARVFAEKWPGVAQGTTTKAFSLARIAVPSRADALAVMTPEYWGDGA